MWNPVWLPDEMVSFLFLFEFISSLHLFLLLLSLIATLFSCLSFFCEWGCACLLPEMTFGLLFTIVSHSDDVEYRLRCVFCTFRSYLNLLWFLFCPPPSSFSSSSLFVTVYVLMAVCLACITSLFVFHLLFTLSVGAGSMHFNACIQSNFVS